jgi:outer membrane protein OmpA-like peptidoglycan-associated protein
MPDKIRKILLFVILFVKCSGSFCQTLHTTSNRALKAYNEGKQAFDYFDFKDAENFLKEAISIDKKFYEAYMVLGEMMTKLKRFPESATYYRKAVQIDSLFYKPVFFPLANAEKLSGNYADALVHYSVYIVQPGILEKNRNQSLRSIEDCKFAIEAIKNPVPFSPVSLGDSINTSDDEYWPSITVDGQTLMFTRQVSTGRSMPRTQEDFYLSHMSNGLWGKALNAGFPLNTSSNEGAQTLSSDGRYMYFTACEKQDGQGSCDIYYSSYDGKIWSLPYNIGPPVNSRSWESQPSVSANGKMLFFASNRAGGAGGMDLWYSVLGEDGKWKLPVNPGLKINSSGDEMSPFIHFDGKTLYFSSNGRVGMGGYDIYFTKMREDTSWTDPINLGYPINTFNDELGLIIDARGGQAYFSSIRDNTHGKDIFSFLVYEAVRPDPVSYFKGRVYDKFTGKSLRAGYELIDLKTGRSIISDLTDQSGVFLVCLPSDHNYGLNVNKEGYLFYSDNFMFEGIHSASEPFIKKIDLSPVREGEKITLSNVFYEFDSWKLTKESFPELNRLVRLLKDNKDIIVEIGGYTDAIGKDSYNLDLSEKRARSVKEFIIEKGITAERLSYKGFGAAAPIGDNVSDSGRKLNRRTEVKIIGNRKNGIK